ncbi:hypothetical protein SAMN05216582_14013 [Selenomonas ruminantium]|uniref:Uncharacterized protein n=1 Tax=Selenomonas ruminantium TaxID=971 RepID=A0A1M6XPA7_SELRU|nr:hypothetical protein [Selenomonas ruminantium]SHL07817.1 hypothetical protein SAMN05216582_14013 [Selenomonas ruminantium]
MAGIKKQTKRVVRALNDWNKPRFVELDEFCKASLKVNKIKVNEFANVLTEDIFRPLANVLGENSERPLVALATSKEKIGKVIYLAESAKRDIEAIDKAISNEELFRAQNRLRELCAAVVEESMSIMNYEGTPFEIKG